MLLLIPVPIPTTKIDKLILNNDGSVVHLGSGLFWMNDWEFAFHLSDTEHPHIAFNIKYVSLIKQNNNYSESLVFFILENFSGIFVCNLQASSICEPLSQDKYENYRTNPVATCMDVKFDFCAYGDSFGNIYVWNLKKTAFEHPEYILNAHGKLGCGLINIVNNETIITIGGIMDEIKIWKLVQHDHLCYREFSFDSNNLKKTISTNTVHISLDEVELIICGFSDGQLMIWDIVNNDHVFMKLFKERRVEALAIWKHRYIIVSSSDGEIKVCCLKELKVVIENEFSTPFLGIVDDQMVFDEKRKILVENIAFTLEKQNEPTIDQVELAKYETVLAFSRSYPVLHLATKKALDKPRNENTLGKGLVKIDPFSDYRSCCLTNESVPKALWVKRKIKPPTKIRRRPLFEPSNHTRDESTKVPPFCKTRYHPDWVDSNCFLNQNDVGEIIIEKAE